MKKIEVTLNYDNPDKLSDREIEAKIMIALLEEFGECDPVVKCHDKIK